MTVSLQDRISHGVLTANRQGRDIVFFKFQEGLIDIIDTFL